MSTHPLTNTKSHTPGPWHENCCRTHHNILDSRSRVVAVTTQHGGSDEYYPLIDEANANARLIAAAPDMFSVLQRVVMDGLPIEPETLKEITFVLAKASTGAA